MKKIIVYVICIIGGLSAVIALILSAAQIVIFDENRFHEAYEKYDRYEYIGISQDDLHEVTHELLEYLKGNRSDIIMYADINGEEEMVFEDREQQHMVDVLYLFEIGFAIRNICTFIAFVACIIAICIYKQKSIKIMSVGYLAGFGTIILALGAFVIAMLRDFSALFTQFHMLLFDNDLWLLDPKTDIMINMFPEAFFNSLGVAIGVYAIIFITVPAAIAAFALIKYSERKKGFK